MVAGGLPTRGGGGGGGGGSGGGGGGAMKDVANGPARPLQLRLLLRATSEALSLEAPRSDRAAARRDASARRPTRGKALRRAAAGGEQQQAPRVTGAAARAKAGRASAAAPRSTWSADELRLLHAAVRRHGRDWVAVARDVGSKSRDQCTDKARAECAAGRMEEPDGKRILDSWSKANMVNLKKAVGRHGRNWIAVSREVGKTREQCKSKVKAEVDSGRMPEPGGKLLYESWSKPELLNLKQAVDRHGNEWAAVSRDVVSKTRVQCKSKVATELRAGRWRH